MARWRPRIRNGPPDIPSNPRRLTTDPCNKVTPRPTTMTMSAQSLARQLGVYQPDGHHGCLRDGLEPVRHQPRPDPLALRGRLGSSFARSVAGICLGPEIKPTLPSRNLRRSVYGCRRDRKSHARLGPRARTATKLDRAAPALPSQTASPDGV